MDEEGDVEFADAYEENTSQEKADGVDDNDNDYDDKDDKMTADAMATSLNQGKLAFITLVHKTVVQVLLSPLSH